MFSSQRVVVLEMQLQVLVFTMVSAHAMGYFQRADTKKYLLGNERAYGVNLCYIVRQNDGMSIMPRDEFKFWFCPCWLETKPENGIVHCLRTLFDFHSSCGYLQWSFAHDTAATCVLWYWTSSDVAKCKFSGLQDAIYFSENQFYLISSKSWFLYIQFPAQKLSNLVPFSIHLWWLQGYTLHWNSNIH